jgi:hypothetical protein
MMKWKGWGKAIIPGAIQEVGQLLKVSLTKVVRQYIKSNDDDHVFE